MARVPIAENVVPFARVTDHKIETPNMAAGGEMVGRALEGFGGALGDASNSLQVVAAAQDNAATKEAANNVDSQANGLLFTGEQPFFEKRGKDALESRPDVEKRLDDIIAEGRKGLKTPKQIEMFNERVNQQRLSWGARIADHAQTQVFKYDDEQSAAGIDIAAQSAVANSLDPAESRKHIESGIGLIQHRGMLNGWSPDVIKVKSLEFTSGTHLDVATSLAYGNGAAGPQLAEAYANHNRAEMTADGYQAAMTHARTEQNSLDAEQHRIEAEQRRALTEAKREAKDSADSVYRNIQDGVVVKPQDLATAINNARTAGDDALVEGLRQGGLKTSLTAQYANATPGDIQAEANRLSAEITQAGGKVDPDKMVTRDHLQVLADKGRTELKADPFKWASDHLGMAPDKLNLADPNSVAARVKLATTIARRTGTEPVALTQDEVAGSQNTLQHGTTQEKVALALRLSHLGPLATPAAEQLTNNPGFINLIGLSTHGNRGVAASRVNQIVTGYDVLKTKPKLIDKTQAGQQFNEAVGGAFQFLPQVSAGVMSNAQALLGSQANEHGWSEWGQIDNGAWYKSINSALGAYTKDGKQIGGLAKFNGAMTVLPEDMDQTEFETRISKATKAGFFAAHNGEPVYSTGKNPTVTDLKRMAWVPSGDGIYRLTDGSGFLHTKDGRFYEIDIHKLNR